MRNGSNQLGNSEHFIAYLGFWFRNETLTFINSLNINTEKVSNNFLSSREKKYAKAPSVGSPKGILRNNEAQVKIASNNRNYRFINIFLICEKQKFHLYVDIFGSVAELHWIGAFSYTLSVLFQVLFLDDNKTASAAATRIVCIRVHRREKGERRKRKTRVMMKMIWEDAAKYIGEKKCR